MIILKSENEINYISNSCKTAAEVLEKLKSCIRPGISTGEINQLSESLILEKGCKSAFLGYRGYPANICTSVNEEVVHGIPSRRILKNGDIIKLDVGVVKDGYFGDLAATVPVGFISDDAKKLVRVTEEALYVGILKANTENRLGDISAGIQVFVEKNGYSVVRILTGHGIGRALHEEPEVPNYGKEGSGVRLKNGMVFCIEPMVNAGTYEVETKEDKWTVITKDRKLSGHFEHTVAIINNKAEILTKI